MVSMSTVNLRSTIAFCLVFVVAVFACGCSGSQAIWSAELKSPDGKMLATARATAQSGFGTGYIWTNVYLSGTNGSQSSMEILGLSDMTEKPEATSIEMKWLTPTHLQLAYNGDYQTITFQAVKYANIDISIRNTSARKAHRKRWMGAPG